MSQKSDTTNLLLAIIIGILLVGFGFLAPILWLAAGAVALLVIPGGKFQSSDVCFPPENVGCYLRSGRSRRGRRRPLVTDTVDKVGRRRCSCNKRSRNNVSVKHCCRDGAIRESIFRPNGSKILYQQYRPEADLSATSDTPFNF